MTWNYTYTIFCAYTIEPRHQNCVAKKRREERNSHKNYTLHFFFHSFVFALIYKLFYQVLSVCLFIFFFDTNNLMILALTGTQCLCVLSGKCWKRNTQIEENSIKPHNQIKCTQRKWEQLKKFKYRDYSICLKSKCWMEKENEYCILASNEYSRRSLLCPQSAILHILLSW